CRPPQQVIDHDLGLLVQLGKAFLYISSLEMGPECCNGNVNGRSNWRQLNLDGCFPQLLNASGAHYAAVTHERSSLAVPLRVNAINRILEHSGGTVVIFGRYEYESIGSRDLRRPCLHYRMFIGRATRHGGRHRLVEERHWEITEIEKPHFNALALAKLLSNPFRRLFGKPALTGATDDH